MKKHLVLLAVGIILAASWASAADETTVQGTLYAHWTWDLSDGADDANEFALSRAYVTVRSKLSEYTSVRITADLRETDNFDGYSVILKYGYIDWKPKFVSDFLTVRFGLQPTLYIAYVQKTWGRRYVSRVATDLAGFRTSSDLGVGAFLDFTDHGAPVTAAFHVWNGTSYSEVEELNKQKDFSGLVMVKPAEESDDFKGTQFFARYHMGYQNEEIPATVDAADFKSNTFSVSGLLAYRRTIDAGFDLSFNEHGRGAGMEYLSRTAYSIFGTVYLEDFAGPDSPLRTLNLFGRMDINDPDTDTDDDGDTMLIGGLECFPAKGFRASVNLRNISYESAAVDDETYLYLNTMFSF